MQLKTGFEHSFKFLFVKLSRKSFRNIAYQENISYMREVVKICADKNNIHYRCLWKISDTNRTQTCGANNNYISDKALHPGGDRAKGRELDSSLFPRAALGGPRVRARKWRHAFPLPPPCLQLPVERDWWEPIFNIHTVRRMSFCVPLFCVYGWLCTDCCSHCVL